MGVKKGAAKNFKKGQDEKAEIKMGSKILIITIQAAKN